MAIDSKLKRMSAVGARRLPWMRRFTPSPESSVDQADRQHVAFLYRGILAGAAQVTATLIGAWSNVIDCRGARDRIETHGHRERIEVR